MAEQDPGTVASGISTELISRPLVLLSGTSGHLRPKVFLVRGHIEKMSAVSERGRLKQECLAPLDSQVFDLS